MSPSSLTQKTEFLVDRRLYTTTLRFFFFFFLYAAKTYFSVAMWFILSYSLTGEWQISLAGTTWKEVRKEQENKEWKITQFGPIKCQREKASLLREHTAYSLDFLSEGTLNLFQEQDTACFYPATTQGGSGKWETLPWARLHENVEMNSPCSGELTI